MDTKENRVHWEINLNPKRGWQVRMSGLHHKESYVSYQRARTPFWKPQEGKKDTDNMSLVPVLGCRSVYCKLLNF